MPLFTSGCLGLGLTNLVLFTSLVEITNASLVCMLLHDAPNLAVDGFKSGMFDQDHER